MNDYEQKNRAFNQKINDVKSRNFYVPEVNQPKWDNPFLLDSKNDILNKLLKHKDVLLKLSGKQVKGVAQALSGLNPMALQRGENMNALNPTSQFNDLTDTELAGLVQDLAYQKLGERQDIQGFTKISDVLNDNIVAYRSINGNKILLGVAGTRVTSVKDWLTDASLGAGSSIALKSDRFTNLQKAYETIRKRNPNAEIIVGGHSLGGAIVLELLKNNLNDNKLKAFGFNGWINPEYSGAGDPRYKSLRTSGDLVADVKAHYHGGVKWAETHIKDPEELSKYKKAIGLLATGHMVKEGYGAFKNFLKNQNRQREADAMEWAINDQGGMPDVDEFARRSGITPEVNEDGLTMVTLGRGTSHELDLNIAGGDVVGGDIHLIADAQEVTGENFWEEGESLAIETAESNIIPALGTGVATGVGLDLIAEKLLAHKSKNFVTDNAKAKLIGEDKSDHLGNVVKAGVGGAVIGGAVGAGKGEVKARAIAKFKELTEGLGERALNKIKDIARGFRDLTSSVNYSPLSQEDIQLPVPELPPPIGSTASQLQLRPFEDFAELETDEVDGPPLNAETILNDPVGTATRNIDGLSNYIEGVGEFLESNPELLFTGL